MMVSAAAIDALLKSNMSKAMIARKLGVTRQAISKRTQKTRPPRIHPDVLDAARKKRRIACDLRMSGKTFRVIADEMKLRSSASAANLCTVAIANGELSAEEINCIKTIARDAKAIARDAWRMRRRAFCDARLKVLKLREIARAFDVSISEVSFIISSAIKKGELSSDEVERIRVMSRGHRMVVS
jgi:DNA invertase Pin-like site-specific DNA recombinase